MPLPLEYGTRSFMSLDDICTDLWLTGSPHPSYNGNTFRDISQSRISVTSFPTVPKIQLQNPFTFFRTECPWVTNTLLDNVTGLRDAWIGEILVVKHETVKLNTIVDVVEQDISLINLLIRWYIIIVFFCNRQTDYDY